MKRLIICLFVAAIGTGCRSAPPEPAVVTPQMEAELLAGFNAIISAHDNCADMDAFMRMHTTQAQAAMTALDSVADPAFLEPDFNNDGPNRGALWVCLVARQAGMTSGNVKVIRHVIDPRQKLARVIFELRGGEYGFPMARQDGTWRSPFPGQVFLAAQFNGWLNEIKSRLPEDRHELLLPKLSQATKVLGGYQPNWALYPELSEKETDELQLKIKENVRKAVGQE
ncbi:MAG TPA: hypothetical protein PLC24_02115 [Myxococcota bacterium]|nr:hypothetical protein [Myxococcota bacterium]